MRGRFVWLAGLLCLGPGLRDCAVAADERPKPAAPLHPYQRLLRGEDARKAKELEEEVGKDWVAGRFEEALRRAEALVALRQKVQGADHWQTADARWLEEQVRHILKQDAAARRDMAGVPELVREAQERQALASWHQSQVLWEKILGLHRKVLREGDPGTALSYSQLAYTLNRQGQYRAAQSLYEKALAIYRRSLGEDHPRTALAYSNVAANIEAQGRYAAAEPSRRKTLAIYRKAFGEDHPDTARAYNDLAGSLHLQGQHAAAQPLFEMALAIRQKVLGEDHLDTARAYNNLASNLDAQAKYSTAEPLLKKSLSIRRKLHGDAHPDTAIAYHNLAQHLYIQGRYAAAEPLYKRALAILRRQPGEDDPRTATAYGSLGLNLNAQGHYAEAQPLFEKSLAIRRKFDEEHPETARAYNNLGFNQAAQGRYAAAQPLYEKSLAIRRKVLGEHHPDTATGYDNLALNLDNQGQHVAAQPLHERALAISRTALGEEHRETALRYANAAYNLGLQGRYAAAQRLLEKALGIFRKVVGEEHPDTARAYHNLAGDLSAQGQYAAARALDEKALAIYRKVLGEEHPDTASTYFDLAAELRAQGRYVAAQPLYEMALTVCRKGLGEAHADTVRSYNGLAWNLACQGRYAAAETYWTKGTDAFARARLLAAASGLKRLAVTARDSPLPMLAAVLARNGKPEEAWRRFEQSLSRGTWDDLSARLRRAPAERERLTALAQELRRLDQRIERTFTPKETPELRGRREKLLTQWRSRGDELAALTQELEKQYGPVAGQVYDRAAIQHVLPPDAALIGWIDIPGEPQEADPKGEHWAVLLRAKGGPAWERLHGTGMDSSWTAADSRLSADLRGALLDTSRDWHALAGRLRAQRLQPLAKHFAARDGLPAVRRLIVLPSPALAGLPLEVCANGYTVSYAPSGTIFAYLRQLPTSAGRGMLALADPVFDAAKQKAGPPSLPPGGLLVTMVVPNGNAARARMRVDDVLLRYAGDELKALAELGRLIQQHAQDREVPVTVWRAGQTAERTVAGGPLGLAVARQPAAAALTERYQNDRLLARSRSAADEDWPELPGTRVEADGLRRLCAAAGLRFRLLADSAASEQELDRLARTKELAGYRYIHLATHGDFNDHLPLQSAVILSRDHLPDALKQLESGRPVYTGRLTAEAVLERWDLHAELVTLSACESALGKYEGGEGFVGFTQALLLSGARSVCLSLWRVDDTATALLMQRFYANLLGQRPGLKKPLGMAEALAEAKQWLRDLSADEAARQAAALTQGVARGKGRKPFPAAATPKAPATTKASRPYAHPYYWAAFVLVGDGS
jgi:CHAT domain-containing protein/tetratricopeptide (TPR) repeat protein